MSERVLQVSEIVSDLQANLERNPQFQNLLIEGEVSNLRIPYTGHWYFSLKDEHSALDCAFLSYQNRYCRYKIKNGDKVIVRGGINVYTPQGRVQFRVQALKPSGQGDLLAQLEELKRKLSSEGLFDPAHKKPLPRYPMDIAIVTGNATAAREDIYRTFRKRWPIAKLTDYYAPVQGKDAPPKIIEALRRADADHHELIILARGGGSIEDLWCFNDEALARCIYSLNTPVVTGVGHEIDTTLVDYVSDHRSVTPTGAVEDSTPDIQEVLLSLDQTEAHLTHLIQTRLNWEETRFRRLSESPVFLHSENLTERQKMQLNVLKARLNRSASSVLEYKTRLLHLSQRLSTEMRERINESDRQVLLKRNDLVNAMQTGLEQRKNQFSRNAALLDAYSPLKVLSRGYSIALKNNDVVRSTDQVKSGDSLSIHVQDGLIYTDVTGKEKENGTDKKRNI